MKNSNLAALAAVLALVSAAPAAALDWSDNSFRVQWGASYREPGVLKAGTTDPQDIAKTTLNFSHASGDKLGDTFLSVDMYISDRYEPAAGQGAPVGSADVEGATEVFVVGRRNFSLNKITDSDRFSFSVVRDVALGLGLDIGAKNNAFASHIVRPFLGATFSFKVPGFLNVGVYASKEWNNNGFMHAEGTIAYGGPVSFDVTPAVLAAWGIPIGKLPLQFAGFANVILPKGKDGFGNDTATEFITQPKLVWDVARTFTAAYSGYELAVGYQYWLNKYGEDNSLVVNGAKVNNGALAHTFFFEAAIHL